MVLTLFNLGSAENKPLYCCTMPTCILWREIVTLKRLHPALSPAFLANSDPYLYIHMCVHVLCVCDTACMHGSAHSIYIGKSLTGVVVLDVINKIIQHLIFIQLSLEKKGSKDIVSIGS